MAAHEHRLAAALPTAAPRRGGFPTARLAQVASVPLLIALWQGVCSLGLVNPILFPPPTVVAAALWEYVTTGEGWTDLGASVWRVAVGYSAGAVVGVVVGLYTGTRPLVSGLLSPALQLLRPIPPIAFVPVVIVWFGLTEWGKWFLIFWGVFFAVWMSAHMGVQRVNENLVRAALSLGESPRRLLWRVQLPAAAPVVLVGLRTAVSIAFYTLVAAELSGAYAGIAYRMELTQQNMQIGHTLAGLVLLGVTSAIADKAFVWASRRVVHWSA